MPPDLPHDPKADAVNQALRDWRQGDCVLGETDFVHLFKSDYPLSEGEFAGAEDPYQILRTEVHGLVVVTQTCDIQRPCRERPFVEVCPLVEKDPDEIKAIEKARHPRFGFVPGVADRLLVAHLDRVMTVEKPLVASWTRTAGCTTDREMRSFSDCLSRKRSRFAFPDDFDEFAKRLRNRLQQKHGNQTPEGEALRALREIRVRAAPSWKAESVSITLFFVPMEEADDFQGKSWASFVDGWMKLVPPSGRFTNVAGLVQYMEDLSALDYVESDRLDLDHLSSVDEE
ncbi:MAG: hypothetical protein AAB074_22765 [Planctomycetota bacterium]